MEKLQDIPNEELKGWENFKSVQEELDKRNRNQTENDDETENASEQTQEEDSSAFAQELESRSIDQYLPMSVSELNKLLRAQENPLVQAALYYKMIINGSDMERTSGYSKLEELARSLGDKRGSEREERLDRIIAEIWTVAGTAYEHDTRLDEGKRKQEALRCYKEAHEKDEDFFDNLVRCYSEGIGTEKDPERAYIILNALSEREDYNAAMAAGCYNFQYGNGINALRDFSRAASLAAASGGETATYWESYAERKREIHGDMLHAVYSKAKTGDCWAALLLLVANDELHAAWTSVLLEVIENGNRHAREILRANEARRLEEARRARLEEERRREAVAREEARRREAAAREETRRREEEVRRREWEARERENLRIRQERYQAFVKKIRVLSWLAMYIQWVLMGYSLFSGRCAAAAFGVLIAVAALVVWFRGKDEIYGKQFTKIWFSGAGCLLVLALTKFIL